MYRGTQTEMESRHVPKNQTACSPVSVSRTYGAIVGLAEAPRGPWASHEPKIAVQKCDDGDERTGWLAIDREAHGFKSRMQMRPECGRINPVRDDREVLESRFDGQTARHWSRQEARRKPKALNRHESNDARPYGSRIDHELEKIPVRIAYVDARTCFLAPARAISGTDFDLRVRHDPASFSATRPFRPTQNTSRRTAVSPPALAA